MQKLGRLILLAALTGCAATSGILQERTWRCAGRAAQSGPRRCPRHAAQDGGAGLDATRAGIAQPVLQCGAVGSAALSPPRGILPAATEAAEKIDVLLVGAPLVTDVPLVIEAPPLESWPRAWRGAGPFYVLLNASPYTGQFGVVADADRADEGWGFGAVVGRRVPRGMSKTAGFEIVLESSSHFNSHSQVDASATRVGFGLTRSFRPDEKLQPFVLAGAGYYMLQFEGLDKKFDISGPGGYFGGGVDLVAAKHLTARLELRLHVWSAADGSGAGGVAETATFALGVATGF